MAESAKIRPVNSLVFISDLDGGEPPVPRRDAMILATPSCISVCCYPEQDGPTEIILGNTMEVDPGATPAFDGELEAPSRAIVVSTVDGEVVLETTVTNSRERLRIWLSHARWPEKVIVGLG